MVSFSGDLLKWFHEYILYNCIFFQRFPSKDGTPSAINVGIGNQQK